MPAKKKASAPSRAENGQPPMPPTFRTRSFMVIFALAALLAYLIFKPFIVPGVLALITACLLRSLYLFYLRLFGNRESLASGTTLLTVVMVILIPMSLVMLMLIREGIRFVSYAQANIHTWLQAVIGFLEKLARDYPFLQLEKIDFSALLPRVVDETLKFVMNLLNSAAQGGATFVFQLIVFLFCLYYFFIDWQRLGAWIESHSPFETSHNQQVFAQFISMGRSVLKSTLIIGVIQGVIGGLALALTGFPSPIFWGVVMILLSLLPVIGSVVVWGPAGVILLFGGRPLAGILLLLFGLIVISNIDNFLRPKLVGNETSLHPLLVFLSTLGGIALFGFSGFILGPVIVAMISSLLQIYQVELRPAWLKLDSRHENQQ